MNFTKEELVACVERELTQRARVYGHRVREGKTSASFADLEMRRMRAVLEVVRGLPDEPPRQPGLFGGKP